MGPEGALVRRIDDGGWQWADVGEYAYRQPDTYDVGLLGGEWLAAAALPFLLAIAMTGLFRHRRLTAVACAAGVAAWGGYAWSVALFRSEGREALGGEVWALFALLGILAFVVFPGLSGVTAMFIAGHGGRQWLWRSLLGVALWMAPYLLWLEGSITSYPVAAGMAVLLTALNLAAAYHAYARWFADAPAPPTPPTGVDAERAGGE